MYILLFFRYIYGGKLFLKEFDTSDIIKLLDSAKIQIWEHVIKWGLAQNPELPSDLTNYSQDDFNKLKNTLQRFIPLIKFSNITSKEFIDKVFPYEKIFPVDLYKNFLRVFLSLSDPNIKPSNKSEYSIAKESKNEIDSKIITYQHAELISKWVDKLNISDKLISLYKFKLLFRASRDRYSRDVFHVVCDNQPRTVAIVKVKDSNEILGGYNPLEWNCYENFVTTEDSFIFSFSNDRIDNHILSRVIKEHRATFNSCQYGPSFGVSDLEIWSLYGGNCCKKSSYENPIRDTEGQFVVEDFEVFQILRE
ncbi:hypothetical protein RclHR1_07060010 [Rhizophagus clarus]|uniref:TLDc domain-containing protein n=1 Tax=Rhizophagus clarus TaxID=94130 RepID=A0A2Z6SK69_9GLOM|nr:hypothetical protein RclHR1_07060010 [Rhizophagus clarus]